MRIKVRRPYLPSYSSLASESVPWLFRTGEGRKVCEERLFGGGFTFSFLNGEDGGGGYVFFEQPVHQKSHEHPKYRSSEDIGRIMHAGHNARDAV